MATYNGHKNKNAWNVSMHISATPALNRLAANYVMDARHRGGYTMDDVAKAILEHLHADGLTHTPDGVRYTKSTIKLAIRGF